MSSSEERSIPEAAPLPCQYLPCGTRIVDLREVVDHDGNGGGIEDLLEETEDRLSVITHGESEVPFDISLELNHNINCNVPGQMTIEWVAPASAASLVSSMVVAADPPGCQLLAREIEGQMSYLRCQQVEAHLGNHCCPKPFGRSQQLPFAQAGKGEKLMSAMISSLIDM
jgi:hypothetical protein